MLNHAASLYSTEQSLATPINFSIAEIIAKTDEHYVVKTASHSFIARTASSFLFVPEIHDQVLLLASSDTYFILQILQRPTDFPLELRISKALTINAKDAELTCQTERLHLNSQHLTLDSKTIDTRAEQVSLNWQQLDYQGQHCNATIDTLAVQARICDTVIDTLTVKAKQVLQWISELKQQMLGRLHISVQKHYQLDCESADIYSQEDVKIDAKQIHLG